MIKAMKMNKLSYWKLHLMLVKVKISDNDVTRESVNAYYPLKDNDAETGQCKCYWSSRTKLIPGTSSLGLYVIFWAAPEN